MTLTGRQAARALLADVLRFAGPRLPRLAALIAGGALAESLGIVLLLPLLALADGGAGGGRLRDFASQLGVGRDALLALLLAGFLLLMLLRSAALYLRDTGTAALYVDYQAALRLRAIEGIAAQG